MIKAALRWMVSMNEQHMKFCYVLHAICPECDEGLAWKQQDPVYPGGLAYWFSVFWSTTNTSTAPFSRTHPTFFSHVHLLLMTWPQLMFSHCQIYIHPASSSPSPVSLQCQIVTQDEYHDWQPGKLRRPVTHLPISVSEGYLRLASPLFLFLLSSTILLPPSVLSYLLNGLVASPSLKSSTAPRKPERDRNCTEKHL